MEEKLTSNVTCQKKRKNNRRKEKVVRNEVKIRKGLGKGRKINARKRN